MDLTKHSHVHTYLGLAPWFEQYIPSLARSSLGKRRGAQFPQLHKTLASLSHKQCLSLGAFFLSLVVIVCYYILVILMGSKKKPNKIKSRVMHFNLILVCVILLVEKSYG